MTKKQLQELSTKDKMLIFKALVDIVQSTYDEHKDFILKQVLNNSYISAYGKFYKRRKTGKTIQEKIDANNCKIEECKKLIEECTKENAQLQKVKDKTALAEDESFTLVSEHTSIADEEALKLIKSLVKDLDSKKINKTVAIIRHNKMNK